MIKSNDVDWHYFFHVNSNTEVGKIEALFKSISKIRTTTYQINKFYNNRF